MNYKLIKSNNELSSYLGVLREKNRSIVALDIEAESNMHAYGEKLCLVQIFDGVRTVLVDPLQIDLELLKTFFENRNILKIIYDAASDLSLMKNACGIEIKSILDLRPAVSLLNLDKQDLHSVLASELGVLLENKARFQKYNWTLRPISPEAIEYALGDVIYLFRLKEALFKKLYENNLLDTYILSNLKVQNKDYTRNPEDKYTRINGYRELLTGEKHVVLEVGRIIEKYAREYDIPSHWIINKNDIIEIIKNPESLNRIRLPEQLSRVSKRKFLSELKLAVVKISEPAIGLISDRN